jgi:serine/threonine protein kinase/HAMP domain-containing protein
MGETTPKNPIAGTLEDLDALGGGDAPSNTVFDPQVEGPAKTVLDPTALTSDSMPAANEPRRALTPKPAAATLALPPGFRLHEYRIDRVLGQGGFGIAYAATDVNLAARVVIKEYLPEDFAFRALDNTVQARDDMDQEFYQSGLDSFLVEARTLATFRHRHIVRVARFFEANKTAYMVLEYERGESLKSWRRKRGDNIDEKHIVALLAPLLDGLDVVHKSGYLHRDIKPDNIYVRDEDGSLVLLDFGAARQTAIEKSEIGMVVTPGYGPIEQYAGGGRQGPWTDIYSLGATLFWLITGRKPLEAPARLGEPDPLPSAESLGKDRFSPQFLRAIDWALKMHPADRPQSVAEFRSALFASHAGALGLQEALQRSDEEGFHPAGLASWAAAFQSTAVLKGKLQHLGRRLRHPVSWPIGVKMTLAMVTTALGPMLITSYYNLNAAQNHVAAVELRNLEQLAQNTAGRVSQLIVAMRGLADYLGTDDDFVAYLRRPTPGGTRDIVAKLEGLGRAHRDIQFSMVMDVNGNAIAATDREVMGRNFRFREYFKKAMEGESYMTGIIVGSVAGASGFFFARPVFAPDATVIGAVVMRVRADPVGRIVSGAKLDNDRIPFLVDGDGVIIWHPDEKQMFKSLVPLSAAKMKEVVDDKRFRRERIESLRQPELANAMVNAKTPGYVTYTSTVTRREEIAGYAPVPGNDWVVGISESRDYFAAPLDRLFEKVLVSVALAGAIFVALASWFARSITRPIEKLTAAAHALKSGDYDKATVQVRSNDEIGQLARVFQVMIDVLRQREREREGRRGAGGQPANEAPEEK